MYKAADSSCDMRRALAILVCRTPDDVKSWLFGADVGEGDCARVAPVLAPAVSFVSIILSGSSLRSVSYSTGMGMCVPATG